MSYGFGFLYRLVARVPRAPTVIAGLRFDDARNSQYVALLFDDF